MIMKHFHHNEWQLGEDWENTDHVIGAPDSDTQVEQTEKSIATSLEISDDEQDQEEEENKWLSLPPHKCKGPYLNNSGSGVPEDCC
jgi:hypothetical protein